MPGSPGDARHAGGRIPAGIWALGLTSLFMDVSSEMIHALLPVFLTTTLGASALLVGLVEGVGEATASITRVFSGWWSDRLGRRKGLTVLGYGLGALSKPLFAVAPSVAWVLMARFTDRLGKGIRGAPRDALVGDLAPAEVRGAAYGLRQSLDTIGAFAGPLLAIALMALFAGELRLVFAVAVVPAAASVAVLVLGVREPERVAPATGSRVPIRFGDLAAFDRAFWSVVGVGAVLTLARFSEAFLVLRAADAGLALAWVPLVLVVMNVVYSLAAYPSGALSDRVDRRVLVGAGFGVLVLADLVLAYAPGLGAVMAGVALWGLHMGMTQGLLAALVADAAPASLRGTAFGLFHLASGVALLFASLVAGGLWHALGPRATFLAGAVFATAGLLAALAVMPRRGGTHAGA